MRYSPWKILFFLFVTITISLAEYRIWEGQNGSRTEAEFVKKIGSNVILKKRDGTTVSVPLQKLSDQDQQYLSDLLTQKPSASTTAGQESAQSQQIKKALEGVISREKIPGARRVVRRAFRPARRTGSGRLFPPDPARHCSAIRTVANQQTLFAHLVFQQVLVDCDLSCLCQMVSS